MDRALAAMPSPDLSWLEEDDDDLALGPPDDEDYVEAPKPNKAEALAMADELVGLHGIRVGQAREMADAYDGDDPGYFEEDEDLIEDGIIERMPLSTLKQMYKFRSGYIAMHEPYARLVNRESIDRDEAMAVEELVQFDFTCEERQFATEEGGDLRLTEAEHLQRCGMLVGLDTLNPQDSYSGLSMKLINPLTVFPVFGGAGGLKEVYRVYQDTAPNIVGNYGGRPGGPEYERMEKTLERLPPANDDRSGRIDDFMELRTVTEVWNRDHLAIYIDEKEELLSRKHGYRELPFTIVCGFFGSPAAMEVGSGREAETLRTNRGEVLVNDASVDIARRMRPFDWDKLATHRIAEAVAGRDLTMLKWALNPHKVYEFDPVMGAKNKPHFTALLPGETTEIPLPGKLNLITPIVDPLARAGVNLALAANASSGILGQIASGAVPPQTSGSALNGMVEMGAAADAALVRLIQIFWRLRAEKRLYLRMMFGGLLGRPKERGFISVPNSRGSGAEPMYRVTPDMIRRVGVSLEVEAHFFRVDVGTAQYLSTLRAPSQVTGLPLISDETAMRKLKAVPDPDRERERIEDEQILAMPAVARVRTLRRLKRERDQALAEEDFDSVDDNQSTILQLEFLQEADIMSGNAAPPAMGAEGGAAPAQMAAPDQPRPQLPGTSLPEQGIDVGTEGGRPVGATPPAMTPVGGPRQGGY